MSLWKDSRQTSSDFKLWKKHQRSNKRRWEKNKSIIPNWFQYLKMRMILSFWLKGRKHRAWNNSEDLKKKRKGSKKSKSISCLTQRLMTKQWSAPKLLTSPKSSIKRLCALYSPIAQMTVARAGTNQANARLLNSVKSAHMLITIWSSNFHRPFRQRYPLSRKWRRQLKVKWIQRNQIRHLSQRVRSLIAKADASPRNATSASTNQCAD